MEQDKITMDGAQYVDMKVKGKAVNRARTVEWNIICERQHKQQAKNEVQMWQVAKTKTENNKEEEAEMKVNTEK